MKITTTAPAREQGRTLALVAGFLASTGALAILLQDGIRSGVWTLEHGLIPLLMAVQIISGHLAVSALTQWRVVSGLGFALVAITGTWGILYTSVGKQSSVQAETSLAVEARNSTIADKALDLKRARDRLADAEKMVDLETKQGGCPDKRRDGRRSNCSDWKQRADEVRSHIAVLDGEIRTLGTPAPVGAKAEKMATLIASLTGRNKDAVKSTLVLIEPFTYALIFELAALVAFGFAFGHGGKQVATPAPAPATAPANPLPPPPGPGKGAHTKDQALADLLTRLASGRPFASQDEMAAEWLVAKGTVSKWLTSWEAAGFITRAQIGKCKVAETA